MTTGPPAPAETGEAPLGYDSLHRLTSDTLTHGGTTLASISYGYDLNGDLTSKTTTGLAGAGTSTYGYDRAGRLTSWTTGAATTGYPGSAVDRQWRDKEPRI